MKKSKLLTGALVCLLGLSTVTSCNKEPKPEPEAPTEEELQEYADGLLKKVVLDSSTYVQATKKFTLTTGVWDEGTFYPITWKTSDKEHAGIIESFDKEGYQVLTVNIKRPAFNEENLAYTLTASLTYEGQTRSKEFNGYVIKEEAALSCKNIAAVYEALESKTISLGAHPVEVKAYISYVVNNGYYVQSAEDDRAMYVYDKGRESYKANGFEKGDQLLINGPVDSYSSYQFKAANCAIKKVVSESKVMELPKAAKEYTPEELADLDTSKYYHEIYGTQWVIEGKVKVDASGKYPSYYLETPTGEGKWEIKFDFGSSVKDPYNALGKLDGQTVKAKVFYYGHYQSQHKLGIIEIVK